LDEEKGEERMYRGALTKTFAQARIVFESSSEIPSTLPAGSPVGEADSVKQPSALGNAADTTGNVTETVANATGTVVNSIEKPEVKAEPPTTQLELPTATTQQAHEIIEDSD
jgi:hypothetical protein